MRALFSCLLVLAAVTPNADGRLRQVLDSYIDAHAANGDFSGIVLVTRHGEKVYEKTAGFASRSFDVPFRPDTRFTVASVTKTFTAAGIALLEKQGKLKITDPLETYLPGFPPKILLWHLLAHQAGLADPEYDTIAARDVRPDELLAMIAAQPPLFEAGSTSRYGNAAYVVLARIIEKVSGKPFDQFLRETIFTPLSMSQSGTWRSGAIVPRLATGYIPGVGDGFLVPQPRDPSTLFGSGNVISTTADLDRWLTAVDRHTLFDVTKQPYPFGWGKRDWFGKAVLVQSGITNGYSSIILTVPADELHLVVLMNTQSGFTGDEGKALLGAMLGEPLPPPPRRGPPASVPKSKLDRLAGDYSWGERKIPMHLASDGSTLTLRWADSASVVPLTPVSETEFLDRTSFGRVRFDEQGLVWTQNGEDTRATRAKPAKP
jgi:CubicO group peptidase (beta-lactamase class C family)